MASYRVTSSNMAFHNNVSEPSCVLPGGLLFWFNVLLQLHSSAQCLNCSVNLFLFFICKCFASSTETFAPTFHICLTCLVQMPSLPHWGQKNKTQVGPWILFFPLFLYLCRTIKAFVSANHRSYLTPATQNMAVFKKDSPNSQHKSCLKCLSASHSMWRRLMNFISASRPPHPPSHPRPAGFTGGHWKARTRWWRTVRAHIEPWMDFNCTR